ncbi:MAG: hypothetical protein Q8764_00330 [Pigeon pea little leaf phytoplasma]|nr:hypothetical protein [Pigeon pea little leaf phytoplasma]
MKFYQQKFNIFDFYIDSIFNNLIINRINLNIFKCDFGIILVVRSGYI